MIHRNVLATSLFRVVDEIRDSYDSRKQEWIEASKSYRIMVSRRNASINGRKLMPKTEWDQLESEMKAAESRLYIATEINTIANNRLNEALFQLEELGFRHAHASI